MSKKEDKLIHTALEYAMGYGIGYVCGKHNLNITQKERIKVFRSMEGYFKEAHLK